MHRFLKLLILGLIFILTLEVCARLDDFITWGAPLIQPYSWQVLSINDSLGRHGRPNAKFKKWRLNSLGLRGPEISIKPAPGVKRIMVLGASEVFGLYESPGNEMCRLFQKELDKCCTAKYQVINAGHPGMSLPRLNEYFQKFLFQLKPQIAVIYPSPMFYLDIEPPRDALQARHTISGPRFELRLLAKSRDLAKELAPPLLMDKLRKLSIHWSLRSLENQAVWDTPPESRLGIFTRHMHELITALQQQGCQVMLTTHANPLAKPFDQFERRQLLAWRRSYPRATFEAIYQMERMGNEIIKTIARNKGLRIVDLEKMVPKDKKHFADFAHFTDLGADVAARALSQSICRPSAQN